MNIVNKNLSRIIKVKLCVDKINSIEDIEDICIQDMNLMQKKLNIDLTEISKLKKLKSLTLRFFEITDEVIEAINQLRYLENIEFSMCTFNTKKELANKIKSLIIYNCTNFSLNMLNERASLEELQLIHSGLVNINDISIFENLKYMKIANCNVISIPEISRFENLENLYLNEIDLQCDIDISKMKKLKFISLNGSKVNNEKDYIEKLRKQNNNLIIEFEKDNLPIE